METPFRRGRVARSLRVPRALVLYPASLVLVAVAATYGSWYWTGLQGGEDGDNPADPVAEGPAAEQTNDTVALVRASVTAARDKLAIPSNLNPDLLRPARQHRRRRRVRLHVHRRCAAVPARRWTASATVVVIGDSHARAWIPAFDRIAESRATGRRTTW